jgi:hypothetical protein
MTDDRTLENVPPKCYVSTFYESLKSLSTDILYSRRRTKHLSFLLFEAITVVLSSRKWCGSQVGLQNLQCDISK